MLAIFNLHIQHTTHIKAELCAWQLFLVFLIRIYYLGHYCNLFLDNLGRAGRFGTEFENGYTTTFKLSDLKHYRKLLNEPIARVEVSGFGLLVHKPLSQRN